MNNNQIIDKYFNDALKRYLYNGNYIEQITIDEAKQFLYYLNALDNIELPYITCSNDKEINFYWFKKDNFILDLGFKGDGLYSYYCRLPNGKEIVEDGVSINTYLPEEIVDVISHILKGMVEN